MGRGLHPSIVLLSTRSCRTGRTPGVQTSSVSQVCNTQLTPTSRRISASRKDAKGTRGRKHREEGRYKAENSCRPTS
eukprot:3081459-Rhodomonas_salina.1